MEQVVPQLPPIPVEDEVGMDIHEIPITQEKPKVSSNDVFYAVATEGYDPVKDWKNAQEEIARTGESSLLTLAKQKWQEDQNNTAKAVITSMMIDPTVPDYEKRATINSYLAGDFISDSLRKKYLIQQASMDTAKTSLDRSMQDKVADNILLEDRIKQEAEAARLIKEADVDFSSVLKGTGAIASQIALSIPAGWAAIYGLAKEKDPAKAAEILKAVQEWGYMPDDAGSQKVMQKFQEVMEFIDIPFKWLGDKVLDFTGSPGAATAAYTASSMVGYYGAYKGGKALLKKKNIPPDSPAATTAQANKANAESLGTAAIVDTTGELARALGTTRENLVADWTLTKLADDLADRPDLVDAIVATDRRLSGLYEETRIDPNIYPVSKIAEDKAAYIAVMTETTGPKLLTSQSILDFEWTEASSYLRGKALFGRNSQYGYDTQMAAEYALEQLKANTSKLPEQGTFNIVERNGQYFIQWEFKRPYEPLEHLVFGENALKTDIWGMDVSRLAGSDVGSWIWPSFMRMKTWIPSIGAQSAWKQARVEQVFLEAQRDLVLKTPHKVQLNSLLREGESTGSVWRLSDVRAKHPELSTKDSQNLYASYLGYRRIEDYLYNMSDRKFRYTLEKDGYETLYSPTGERLGFATRTIPTDTPIKKVWDFSTRSVVDHDPTIPVVKLHDAVKIGDDLYNYARVGSNQLGPVHPGSLNKIPGYITRRYKEWFVVEKQPKNLRVDGNKITEAELPNYRQAVAMAKTRKEAETLRDRERQDNPQHSYEYRDERKDIEDKIIFDSKVYEQYFAEHQKRGGKLPGLNRETEVEDVLVSQTKAIMSLSRLEAFGSYMEHARKQFVKDYGEFTGGKFPDQITDISPGRLKGRMTKEEEARFRSAQQVYKQLEMQQFSSLRSDVVWKGALGAVADALENSFLAKLAPRMREVGEKGMLPVKWVKSLGSHLWLFMRPMRMWVVQPQQLLELSSISPTFLKSALNEVGPIWAGIVSKGHTLKPIKGGVDALGRRGVKEYDEIVSALEKTGIMQAVDTNQMVHGWWKDATEELVQSVPTKIAQTAKKTVMFPSRVQRSIGYDASELMNQVILWLFSRHKWMAENPGKNWNIPEHIAEIGQLTWRMGHGASTRAGMMPMQEGMLSMMAQFIAIPHKSFMQMLSSPDLTPAMRGKLLAARLFWYGKWGVPGGAAMYKIMQEYMPEETDENLNKYARGASDYVMNEALSFLTGTKTDSFWGKSTSTVPESVYLWDVADGLVDMAMGDMEKAPKFPFMNATASIFQTANTLYDMYNIPTIRGDDPNYQAMAWKVLTFAGTMNDIDKALVADQLTKTGQKLGHVQTTGEIIGRLFGVPTNYESTVWDMMKVKGKREKYIKEKSKEIHDRLMTTITRDPKEFEKYWEGVRGFLQNIPEEYKDDIIIEIRKWDKRSQETLGDSLALYVLNNYRTENDGYMQQLRNMLNNTDDPRLKQVNEVMK